jgi:hypothetical protein
MLRKESGKSLMLQHWRRSIPVRITQPFPFPLESDVRSTHIPDLEISVVAGFKTVHELFSSGPREPRSPLDSGAEALVGMES